MSERYKSRTAEAGSKEEEDKTTKLKSMIEILQVSSFLRGDYQNT